MADYYPLLAKALANLPSRSVYTARRAIYERARSALIGQLRSMQPPIAESAIASEDAALDQAIARLEAEYGASGDKKPAPSAPPPRPPAPSSAPVSAAFGKPAAKPSGPETAGAKPTPPSAAPPQAPGPSEKPPAAAPAPGATGDAKPPPPAPPAAQPARPPAPPPAAAPPVAPNPRPLAAELTSKFGGKPPPTSGAAGAPSEPTPTAMPAPIAHPRPLASALTPKPGAKPPAAPPLPAQRQPDVSGAAPAPPVEAELSHSAAVAAPPVAAQVASNSDDDGLAPPVAPSVGDAVRPSAPGRAEASRRNPWPIIILVAIFLAVAVIASLAFLWRETPQELAKTTGQPTESAAPAGANKIAERIKPAGESNAPPAPAAGETPIPTVTVPVASVPAAAPLNGQAPAQPAPAVSGGAAAPADAAAQNASQAQAPPAIAIASRAALLIATASDPQKPLVNLGNAVWTFAPGASGQPATGVIRIEVDVPEQKSHTTVTIRKNLDASLPATHTIDLRMTFADGSQIKGVKDMGMPQLRKEDAPSGQAVSGVRVKINDAYFLVGLTRSDADAARNLDLLATQSWLDFPLLLNDDRIAKLTFEKGATGDRVMAQALDAWK